MRRRWRHALAAGLAALTWSAALPAGTATVDGPPAATQAWRIADAGRQAGQGVGRIAWQRLPAQARETHGLILQGGPFPYERDGTTFFNRERLLPAQPRGYYREYTVPTPRLSHRGARRIVCGGHTPTRPDRCYYTADHYNSFRLIVPPETR